MNIHLEDRFFYRLFSVIYFFCNMICFIIVLAILYIEIPPASNTIDAINSCIICKNGEKHQMLDDFFGFLEKHGSKIEFNSVGRDLANILCSSSVDITYLRTKYPQYNDLNDITFINVLRKKYYYNIPKDQFYKKFGVSEEIKRFVPDEEIETFVPDEEIERFEFYVDDKWEKYKVLDTNIRQKLAKQGINLSTTKQEFIAEDKRRGLIPKDYDEKHPKINSINFSLNILYENRDWSNYAFKVIMCVVATMVYYSIANIVLETLIYIIWGRRFTWKWVTKFIPFLRKNVQ